MRSSLLFLELKNKLQNIGTGKEDRHFAICMEIIEMMFSLA